MEKQIKSRERVMDYGEVYTSQKEVRAMCDLVSDECSRIDSRFLDKMTIRLIQVNDSRTYAKVA